MSIACANPVPPVEVGNTSTGSDTDSGAAAVERQSNREKRRQTRQRTSFKVRTILAGGGLSGWDEQPEEELPADAAQPLRPKGLATDSGLYFWALFKGIWAHFAWLAGMYVRYWNSCFEPGDNLLLQYWNSCFEPGGSVLLQAAGGAGASAKQTGRAEKQPGSAAKSTPKRSGKGKGKGKVVDTNTHKHEAEALLSPSVPPPEESLFSTAELAVAISVLAAMTGGIFFAVRVSGASGASANNQ